MTFIDVAGARRTAADAASAPAYAGSRARAPRIGLIYNPRSHRNKGGALGLDDLAQLPAAVLPAMPRSMPELVEALRRFAAQEIDVLAVDGGDGTIRDVLSCAAAEFGARMPQLLLVPTGKTNALAVDLGLPPRWHLADGLAAVRAARTVARRPIVIERRDQAGAGHEIPTWGFIFGAGAFNAAIATGQVAHRFGAFQGFAVACTAAMGMVQALFGVGSGPWRHSARMLIVGADGKELPHSGRGARDARYLALFSTLRRFPAGIAPFAPEHTDMRYLILDAPLRRVVARLPAILWGWRGRRYPLLGIYRGMGETFDFDLDEGFILDGEVFAPGPIRLRLGPELHFIVP